MACYQMVFWSPLQLQASYSSDFKPCPSIRSTVFPCITALTTVSSSTIKTFNLPLTSPAMIKRYLVIKLWTHSSINLSLIGALTWFTPPGPYRATTCRERELTLDHIILFDHTRTWRASPDEGFAQCRSHFRDNTNMLDDTKQWRTHPF